MVDAIHPKIRRLRIKGQFLYIFICFSVFFSIFFTYVNRKGSPPSYMDEGEPSF